ncbi:hypothetical protein LG634_06540 [Streptomyces bambusae]|uniref:hypothetical protein n=1 Tax=Streptomyces bambusae TaxID=1550616 RepID=UPI001CFCBED4|nr:hypothetical protein [Streptomyces bambusae]MCB5164493.1 hypothetical protein [Streptomyces bambusae]
MKRYRKSLAASSIAAAGAAVITLALPTSAYAAPISGNTSCASARGDYRWFKTGTYDSQTGYRTEGHLTLEKTCAYGLALQYKGLRWVWTSPVAGYWLDLNWETVKSSPGTVSLEDAGPVKDLRFRICDVDNGSVVNCRSVR